MKIYYRDGDGEQQFAEIDFDTSSQTSLERGWVALAGYDAKRQLASRREGKREWAASARKQRAAKLAKIAARDQRIAETETQAA
jgi:hypothetical protein